MTLEMLGPFGVPRELPTALTVLASQGANVSELTNQILSLIQKVDGSISPDQGEKAIPFLYDQEELYGKVSIALTYSIKRLLRGLAAVAPHTRLNYSITLNRLFLEYSNVIPRDLFLRWIFSCLGKSQVSGDSRMNSTEENAMFSGRLMALEVLVDCATKGSVEDLVCDSVLHIWNEKDNLLLECHNILVKIVNNKRSMYKRIQEYISSLDQVNDLKLISLILLIRYESNIEKFGVGISHTPKDLLSPTTFMPILSSIDPNHIDKPIAFAIYYGFLNAFKTNLSAFERCWHEISLILLDRYKLGGPLMSRLFTCLCGSNQEPCLELLFSEEIIKFLARRPAEEIDEIAKAASITPENAILFVRHFLSVNNNDLAMKFVTRLDKDKLPKSISLLTEKELPSQMAIRVADLLLSLLKPRSALQELGIGHEIALEALFKVVLGTEQADPKLVGRIPSAILKILESKKEEAIDLESLLTFCIQRADQFFDIKKESTLSRFENLDEPVKDAWGKAITILKQISKKSSKASNSPSLTAHLKALKTVALVGRLFLFIDPLIVVDIFDDISGCLESLDTKKKLEEGVNPTDVIMDILIQWLSQSSALLRYVADNCFNILTPYYTPTTIESIVRVLKTLPGTENEDLMEDEEGYQSDTEDDDEDDIDFTDNEDEDEDEEDESFSSPSDEEVEIIPSKRSKFTKEESSEESSEAESEVIDLADAKDNELNILDKHLSAIMKARKEHYSAKTVTKQSLIHFKIRVLDWLKTLKTKLSSQDAFLFKVNLAPEFLHVLGLHGQIKDGKHQASEQELVTKLNSIFNTFYQKKDESIETTPNATSACNIASEKILQIIKESSFSQEVLVKAFMAFWYVFQANSGGEESLSPALKPYWIQFVSESDKKHSTVFLSFFEKMRSTSPLVMIQLFIAPEVISRLADARFFTRSKILGFMDMVLKKMPRDSQEHSIKASLYFQSVVKIWKGYLEKGQLNPTQLRDELSLINTAVAKSNLFVPNEAFDIWNELLTQLGDQVAKLEGIQENQRKSLQGKIKSMFSFLRQPQK